MFTQTTLLMASPFIGSILDRPLHAKWRQVMRQTFDGVDNALRESLETH